MVVKILYSNLFVLERRKEKKAEKMVTDQEKNTRSRIYKGADIAKELKGRYC